MEAAPFRTAKGFTKQTHTFISFSSFSFLQTDIIEVQQKHAHNNNNKNNRTLNSLATWFVPPMRKTSMIFSSVMMIRSQKSRPCDEPILPEFIFSQFFFSIIHFLPHNTQFRVNKIVPTKILFLQVCRLSLSDCPSVSFLSSLCLYLSLSLSLSLLSLCHIHLFQMQLQRKSCFHQKLFKCSTNLHSWSVWNYMWKITFTIENCKTKLKKKKGVYTMHTAVRARCRIFSKIKLN